MYGYISHDKLNAACEKAAKELGVTPEEFKRAVYAEKQEDFDRQDVILWLEQQGYKFTDDDVDQILETYRDDYDADRGTWSNIESAYYENDMHLSYIDDEDEISK